MSVRTSTAFPFHTANKAAGFSPAVQTVTISKRHRDGDATKRPRPPVVPGQRPPFSLEGAPRLRIRLQTTVDVSLTFMIQ